MRVDLIVQKYGRKWVSAMTKIIQILPIGVMGCGLLSYRYRISLRNSLGDVGRVREAAGHVLAA